MPVISRLTQTDFRRQNGQKNAYTFHSRYSFWLLLFCAKLIPTTCRIYYLRFTYRTHSTKIQMTYLTHTNQTGTSFLANENFQKLNFANSAVCCQSEWIWNEFAIRYTSTLYLHGGVLLIVLLFYSISRVTRKSNATNAKFHNFFLPLIFVFWFLFSRRICFDRISSFDSNENRVEDEKTNSFVGK